MRNRIIGLSMSACLTAEKAKVEQGIRACLAGGKA